MWLFSTVPWTLLSKGFSDLATAAAGTERHQHHACLPAVLPACLRCYLPACLQLPATPSLQKAAVLVGA